MLQKLKNLVLMLFIFKLVIILSLSPVLVNGEASEEEIVLPDAGTTPDSPFYGLELAIERIQLALTFGNAAKAEKRLQHAEERLAEVDEMVKENKIKAAERARKEHGKIFAKVEIEVKKIDSTEARLKLEKEEFSHRLKVVIISESLGFRLEAKVRGNELTQDQVDAFFVVLEELEIQIEEIDAEVIEVDDDFKKDRREAALDRIEDAREEIEDVEEKLSEFADSERPKLNAAIRLLENAKKHLANAEAGFEEGKYGMAFGQATAAKRLAKNALRILDRLDDHKEDELRIKAHIHSTANVITEISKIDVKGKFFFEAHDRKKLANMLLEELSLSEVQVAEIIEFKDKKDKEEDGNDHDDDMDEDESRSKMKVEVEIKHGFARVKINMRFFSDASDEQAVIKATSMKLNALTEKDILNSIKSHDDKREEKVEKMRMRAREREKERMERENDDKDEGNEDSDSLELTAKITISRNTAEIKYGIGDDEMTFTLDTSDKGEILAALAERTAYPIEDWRKVAEFKVRRISDD